MPFNNLTSVLLEHLQQAIDYVKYVKQGHIDIEIGHSPNSRSVRLDIPICQYIICCSSVGSLSLSNASKKAMDYLYVNNALTSGLE